MEFQTLRFQIWRDAQNNWYQKKGNYIANRCSVQFSHSVVCDSLWPHGLQHTRLPCPAPTPGVYSNSCPSSQWCHPTISSSVIHFSCLQSFPASGSFQMSQFFASGGQSFGVSASASVYLYVKSFTNVSHSVRKPISKISDPTFSQQGSRRYSFKSLIWAHCITR